MVRGCLTALLLYAAIAVGYYFWLVTVFDPPEVYWGSAGLGFIVFCCLGALMNARYAWRDWSLASAVRRQVPPRDGRLLAACGPIHPLGQPLLAPFSNSPCCLCEYDLSLQSPSTSSDSEGKTGSDLAGFLMTPSEIRTSTGNFKLLGFPVLEEGESYTLGSYTAARRARDFVSRTQFEDISGLKLLNVFSAIEDAWTDDDGHVEKNLQLKKVDPKALFPDDLEAVWQEINGETPKDEPETGVIEDDEDEEEELDDDEDEDELDEDEDDSGSALPRVSLPTLKENRVAPGDLVYVIGRYDELRRGIRPSGAGLNAIRLIRGNVETLERKSRSSLWSHLFGGLFFLIVAHAVTYGVMMLYLHNDKNVQKRKTAAFDAAEKGDLVKLARQLNRNVPLDARDSRGYTLLMVTRDAKTAAWLIEQKIDLNAVDNFGNTALIAAASQNKIELIKPLIDAKADLNIRNRAGQTALNAADREQHQQVGELLRAAGAKDDVITAQNGEPLPADGGPQLAAVKQYEQAIRDRNYNQLASVKLRPLPSEVSDELWTSWETRLMRKYDTVEGYTRGDEATIVFTGQLVNTPTTERMTYQLRKVGDAWKIVEDRLDIGGESF